MLIVLLFDFKRIGLVLFEKKYIKVMFKNIKYKNIYWNNF